MASRRLKTNGKLSAIDEWTNLVSLVLGRVSELLIDADVPVAFLEELSRIEYARAACGRARRPSGSVNRSKIAAITGLSRPEVTRLLAKIAEQPTPQKEAYSSSRSARVIAGWTSDPRFQDSSGMPDSLPYTGGARSFTQLAKKYAADVPARALLERLELLGLARVTHKRGQSVQYVVPRRAGSRRDGARKGLTAVVQLLDCLSLADHDVAAPSVLRADIRAGEPGAQIVAMRAATEKAETFLAGIRDSLSLVTPARSGAGVRILVAIAPVGADNPARRAIAKRKAQRHSST